LSVSLSVCEVCIVAKRCVPDKSYYWQPTESRIWGIDWYPNEWPWPSIRDRSRSCQPLRYIRHWISRKQLEIEAWCIGNGLWEIEWLWSMMSSDPERSSRDSNAPRAHYLENSWRCYLAQSLITAAHTIVWKAVMIFLCDIFLKTLQNKSTIR